MADTKAKLTLNGDTAVELDVLKGTLGQDVIDIPSVPLTMPFAAQTHTLAYQKTDFFL